jgi:hypothetical protein
MLPKEVANGETRGMRIWWSVRESIFMGRPFSREK